jgi:undecaprenyl diphosphate synthase
MRCDMDAAEDLTWSNTGMTFTIAFNYGGRTEIGDAVKRLLEDHDAIAGFGAIK